MDSLEDCRLVNSENRPPFHIYGSILANISDLIGRSWAMKISHVLRKVNACADVLAKMGAAS